MNERRCKILYVTADQLMGWFKFGAAYIITRDHLPEDAQFTAVRFDPISKRFAFLVHSEAWNEVPIGESAHQVTCPIGRFFCHPLFASVSAN